MPPREGEDPDVGGLCAGDPLAARLATLKPVPPGVDRDALMFAAGAAAHDRAAGRWKRAFFAQTGVLAAVVVVAVGGVVEPRGDRPQTAAPPATVPRPADAVVSPPASAVAAAEPDADLHKWAQLRADVFAVGLSVLPSPASPPPAADPWAVERSLKLDPGVLAIPHRPKPPPVEADQN